MPMQFNSPVVQRGPCVSTDEALRSIQTVLEALGNPGPIADPTSAANSPCGQLIGPAYVKDIGGTPTVVYVDDAGSCESITPGTGDSVNVIMAYVDGTVLDSDLTFSADGVVNVIGTEANDPVTFDNVHGRAYSDNDLIVGIKDTSTGNYITVQDETGTFSGTTVDNATTENSELICRFEITEASGLTRDLDAAQATRLSDSASIYVLNPWHTFVGPSAYDDGKATSPTSYDGFKGVGVKFTSDHNASGLPGYIIVHMEGWARTLVVEAKEAITDVGQSIECDVVSAYGSANENHRLPPIDDDNYDLTVYDQNSLIKNAKVGDKFLAMMRNEAGNDFPTYDFVAKLEPRYSLVRGQTTAAITRAASTLTLDNVEAVAGDRPVELNTDQITCAIPDEAKINCPENTELFAFFDLTAGSDPTDQWNVGLAANHYWQQRGHVDWDGTKVQVLLNEGTTEPDMKWKEVTTTDVVTAIDSATLAIVSGQLKLTLNCKKRSVKVISNGSETTFAVEATHDVTECT